ncbi:MAG: right-handed parallel beta-helix repeat-containing protein [Phycisphaerae bacterium]|nr:right-handed parallel beta-helix repeat-containing protein [Phycisphaerae bacterium]
MYRMFLSTVVFSLAIHAAAHAADFYVSPGGPYTTIQAAIDEAANGDTVTIADGTWTPAEGSLTVTAKSITLRSANGPEHCILHATRLNLTNLTEGEIRIEGLAFQSRNICISADKVHRLVLDNCTMEQTMRALSAKDSTCELYHCRIRRTGVYYNSGNWSIAAEDTPAVSIDRSPGTAILHGCVISEVYGYGVFVSAPTAVLRNCIVAACSQRAIVAPVPCRLVNCTVINSTVGLSTKNDMATVENCIFWANTTDIGPYHWATDLDRPESITVRNSYIMHGWPGENVYRHDPKITREGWLQINSPCINAGIAVENSSTDVDEEPRIRDAAVDIGADEYHDEDADGLPDHWEAQHFDSPTAAMPDGDDDNDGLTNIQEYERSSFPRSGYWYVDAAQPDDSGDGRIWQTAKRTIAAATEFADAGDIVLVADGWYHDEFVIFFGRPIWIRSANGPDQCHLSPRIILHGHEGADFILDGFTVQGNGINSLVSIDQHGTPTIQNCLLTGGKNGIEVLSGGATVRDCTIANSASDGISMLGREGYPGSARMLRLEGCDIHHNGAEGVNACHNRNIFPLITLRDCSFHHNARSGFWGWAFLDVARCRFEGNKMCGFGITSPDVILRDCVAAGNGWFGLGISSPKDRPAGRLLVENCTVAQNYYRGGIGGFAQGPYPHETVIKNSIIWGNLPAGSPGQIEVQPNVSYVVTHSNIEGGWEGTGNMNREPFFAAPGCLPGGLLTDSWTGGDYRLLSFSPCIDAGDPTYVGALGDNDADGRPRVLHGRLDMGAYENSTADFAPNAQIDAADLMAFAARWLDQSCEEPDWCGGADLTIDGLVDAHDMARLAAEWSLSIRNPAVWWKLDETTGMVAYDSSIFNRIAKLRNFGAACWVPGRLGNALSLDGVDDYLYIDFYSPPAGGRARTVAAWIRTTDTSGVIIAWGPDGVPGGRWTLVTESAGRLRLEVGGGAVVGATNICDNQWRHIAAVFENDGTPNVGDVILYVDGTPELLTAQGDHAIDTLPGEVCIGGNPSSPARMFSGLIDDVRIYDRALAPEEIAELAK